MTLSVGQIADVVDGTCHHVEACGSVSNVVVDSRGARAGALFVAIDGERVDGHAFAAEAIAAGAEVALTSRVLDVPCIVVDDPVLALGRLAHWVRREIMSCEVVAITGSSGKTSTKDLVAQVLRHAGPTVAAEGSFNTEVGVPLTMLRVDASTRFLILEMGMRGLGHIRTLCEFAEPAIGVIVNVGSAHLGLLGSREAVARAKAEILDGLPAEGFAIVPGDDSLVMEQATATNARVVTFGQGPACDVRATDVRLDEQARPSFTLIHEDQAAPVAMRLHGVHWVSNGLAAAAVALCLGMPIEAVAHALSEATPESRWRMEVSDAPGGFTVINDSYNANPESVRAALEALAVMSDGRRSWAVLGEMRELGDASAEAHADLGRIVAHLGLSRLVCVGHAAEPILRAAIDAGFDAAAAVTVPDPDAATALLMHEVRPGDVVLVKASRSIGLERVAAALLTQRDQITEDAL